MEPRLILKNLDNGTFTQAEATDLLIEHGEPAYIIGAYLRTREQRDYYRDELWSLQDEKPRAAISINAITDLVDHALNTGYIMTGRAIITLVEAGMSDETARHHIDVVNAIQDRDFERVVYLDNPDLAPRYCTRCGRKVTAKQLSRRAICVECSSAAIEQNLIGLGTKAGPAYKRWRDSMIKFSYILENEEMAENQEREPSLAGDMIDHDKRPGCDGDCYNCEDSECSYRRDYDKDDDDELPF